MRVIHWLIGEHEEFTCTSRLVSDIYNDLDSISRHQCRLSARRRQYENCRRSPSQANILNRRTLLLWLRYSPDRLVRSRLEKFHLKGLKMRTDASGNDLLMAERNCNSAQFWTTYCFSTRSPRRCKFVPQWGLPKQLIHI